MKPFLLAPFLLVFPTLARADLEMPAIFGDHMVLQQSAKLPVWGTAAPGEIVAVTFGAQRASAVADAHGKWRVELAPVPAGSPLGTLIVASAKPGSPPRSLKFEDVLVGDVWLCAGQSNMEYGIGNDVRGRESIAKSADPQLRLFTVPSNATTAELADFAPNGRTGPSDLAQGKWQVCTPEMLKLAGGWNGFSAVGYYFGRGVREVTHRPVGLIADTRGGTKIDPWISLSGLKKAPAFKNYVEDYRKKSARPDGGGSLGPGVPNLPSSIYNATIAPLKPYAIKGVVWYQGESNAPLAAEYATLFPRLITDWREKWGQGDFPFLFVQLAGYTPKSVEKWPLLRESQSKALALPNTGMATAMDIGNARNIHPNDKLDLGARLVLVARHLVYGDKAVVFSGPVYRSAKPEMGGKVRVTFDSLGGGLVIGVPPADATGGKRATPLDRLVGFTIAAADKKWVPAQARIEGDSVLVWSDLVPRPTAIRYAWAGVPEANLYNKEGLPAPPFRTDDWSDTDEPAVSPGP